MRPKSGDHRKGEEVVLFIGKRHYTNRDALEEKYGRIFQLPWCWSRSGLTCELWLLDYRGRRTERRGHGTLKVTSTPLHGLGWILQWLRQLRRLRHTGSSAVVVASGDCYIGLLAWVLARLSKARFVFDVYDKYDEFGGYRRPMGFDLFGHLRACADATLFASRALLKSLGQESGSSVLVPNGVDEERFRAMDKLVSRKKLGLPEDAVFVGYFGSMEPDRGVADLISAVQALRQETGSNLEVLLGGRVHPAVDVRQVGVRYVGNVPFAEVPLMLASCDVLAVPYRRSAFMDAGASNKIAEAIVCARPLVATLTPNLMANFPDQVAVLGNRLAEPGNVRDLARVLAMQLNEPMLSPMPSGMTWEAIALATARALRLPVPSFPPTAASGSG